MRSLLEALSCADQRAEAELHGLWVADPGSTADCLASFAARSPEDVSLRTLAALVLRQLFRQFPVTTTSTNLSSRLFACRSTLLDALASSPASDARSFRYACAGALVALPGGSLAELCALVAQHDVLCQTIHTPQICAVLSRVLEAANEPSEEETVLSLALRLLERCLREEAARAHFANVLTLVSEVLESRAQAAHRSMGAWQDDCESALATGSPRHPAIADMLSAIVPAVAALMVDPLLLAAWSPSSTPPRFDLCLVHACAVRCGLALTANCPTHCAPLYYSAWKVVTVLLEQQEEEQQEQQRRRRRRQRHDGFILTNPDSNCDWITPSIICAQATQLLCTALQMGPEEVVDRCTAGVDMENAPSVVLRVAQLAPQWWESDDGDGDDHDVPQFFVDEYGAVDSSIYPRSAAAQLLSTMLEVSTHSPKLWGALLARLLSSCEKESEAAMFICGHMVREQYVESFSEQDIAVLLAGGVQAAVSPTIPAMVRGRGAWLLGILSHDLDESQLRRAIEAVVCVLRQGGQGGTLEFVAAALAADALGPLAHAWDEAAKSRPPSSQGCFADAEADNNVVATHLSNAAQMVVALAPRWPEGHVHLPLYTLAALVSVRRGALGSLVEVQVAHLVAGLWSHIHTDPDARDALQELVSNLSELCNSGNNLNSKHPSTESTEGSRGCLWASAILPDRQALSRLGHCPHDPRWSLIELVLLKSSDPCGRLNLSSDWTRCALSMALRAISALGLGAHADIIASVPTAALGCTVILAKWCVSGAPGQPLDASFVHESTQVTRRLFQCVARADLAAEEVTLVVVAACELLLGVVSSVQSAESALALQAAFAAFEHLADSNEHTEAASACVAAVALALVSTPSSASLIHLPALSAWIKRGAGRIKNDPLALVEQSDLYRVVALAVLVGLAQRPQLGMADANLLFDTWQCILELDRSMETASRQTEADAQARKAAREQAVRLQEEGGPVLLSDMVGCWGDEEEQDGKEQAQACNLPKGSLAERARLARMREGEILQAAVVRVAEAVGHDTLMLEVRRRGVEHSVAAWWRTV